MKSVRMLSAAVAAVAIFATSSADAAFLVGGNTRSIDGAVSTIEASVSFAVYKRGAIGGGDSFSTGFAGLDSIVGTAGKYLYLYQLSNDGPVELPIERYFAASISTISSIVAYGFIPGAGLVDFSGAVTAGNPFGTNGPFVPEVSPADLTFSAPAVSLAAVGGLIAPTSTSFGAGLFSVVFGTPLSGGKTSSVFGFTSDDRPTKGLVGLIDGQAHDGTVPVPGSGGAPVLPVPGTGLLFASMLPLLAGAGIRRRLFS